MSCLAARGVEYNTLMDGWQRVHGLHKQQQQQRFSLLTIALAPYEVFLGVTVLAHLQVGASQLQGVSTYVLAQSVSCTQTPT